MAVHTGSEGTVKVGANTIAEIRSFSIEESHDAIEKTAMGDSYRSFSTGLLSWSGSIECWWDETDTNGQGGTALISGKTISASADGMVEASYSVQGSGGLTESTA